MPVVRKKGKNKNHAGSNNGPAVFRYWNARRLRVNKVRRMMRAYGITRAEAERRWDEAKGAAFVVKLKSNPK